MSNIRQLFGQLMMIRGDRMGILVFVIVVETIGDEIAHEFHRRE